jgi:phosphoenolpyruvate carboxykinase (ATP)
MLTYLNSRETWVRDCMACADEAYTLNLRVINEQPAHNLFCYNMFIRPTEKQLENFKPHWTIIQAPGLKLILLLTAPVQKILP